MSRTASHESNSCNLFFPSLLLRVPRLRTRYTRFGGRRRIPLCFALTVALTFVLGSFLMFLLCGSRPSASQLGVVFPGVFKCLLKLPRNWNPGSGHQKM